MPSPYITVLTPTWNRLYTLPRLAASLREQSYRDFEWLVVDDGSTDGSAEYLEGQVPFIDFPLRILRTKNGGKHRALNRGIPEARGAWIFIVDSDDLLPPDALALLVSVAAVADADPRAGGIMGLKCILDGAIVGTKLPVDRSPRDTATLTFVDRIRGDKAEAYKAEILKRFPFPEFEGECFMAENVVWYRIARAGWMLHLTNAVLYLCEYRPDGLSARSFALRLHNPEGNLLYYREALELPFPGRLLAREAVNWLRFAIHAGQLARALGQMPRGRGGMVAALLPVALAAALIDRIIRVESFRG